MKKTAFLGFFLAWSLASKKVPGYIPHLLRFCEIIDDVLCKSRNALASKISVPTRKPMTSRIPLETNMDDNNKVQRRNFGCFTTTNGR